MSDATCTSDHDDVPTSAMRALPASQGTTKGQRHRCAACAYEAGLAAQRDLEEHQRAQLRELRAENKLLKKKLDEVPK